MGVVQSPALLDDHLPGVGAEGGLHGDVADPRKAVIAVEALGPALGPVYEGVEDDKHAGADLLLEGATGSGRHNMSHPKLLQRPDVGSMY